jgi:hypothetical protein
MLEHQPTLDSLQHLVRGRICAHCDSPRRTAAHGPDSVRNCEVNCPLFRVLPHLHEIVVCADWSLRECDQTLRHAIEHAHEQCVEATHPRHAHLCPLCRYSAELIRVIGEVVH